MLHEGHPHRRRHHLDRHLQHADVQKAGDAWVLDSGGWSLGGASTARLVRIPEDRASSEVRASDESAGEEIKQCEKGGLSSVRNAQPAQLFHVSALRVIAWFEGGGKTSRDASRPTLHATLPGEIW